jgi:hypothetical protein
MGYDCSYNCDKIEVVRDLGTDHSGDRLFHCRLECSNEHGHALAPFEALVVVRKYGATIVTDPRNVLDPELDIFEFEDKANEFHDLYESGKVGYDIYNQAEIAKQLQLGEPTP